MNLESKFSEEELNKMGNILARGLNLKRSRDYPDRWRTVWGTKTGLGLIRMLNTMIDRVKEGDENAFV